MHGICKGRLVYKINCTNPHLPTCKNINKIMLLFSTSQIFLPKFSISKLINKKVFHPNGNETRTPSVGVLDKDLEISCPTTSEDLFYKTRNWNWPPMGMELGPSTIIFTVFRDSLTFYQIFLSLQVKVAPRVAKRLKIGS